MGLRSFVFVAFLALLSSVASVSSSTSEQPLFSRQNNDFLAPTISNNTVAVEKKKFSVVWLWVLRISVGGLNLFCIAEYLLYSFFILVCMVYTFKLVNTAKSRIMVSVIFFIVILLEFTVLPMFVMYFPLALYGVDTTYLPSGKKNTITGAALFPPVLVTASLYLIVCTFVVFQIFPFLGSCWILIKYGINPKRKSVEKAMMDNKFQSMESDATTQERHKRMSREQLVFERLSNPKKAPTVLIVMPVYNEDPDALFNAVLSVTKANYLKSCMHLFVSFDDESVSELYLRLLDKMGVFHHVALATGTKDPSINFESGTIGRLGINQPSKVEQQFQELKRVFSDGTVAYDIPTQFTVTFEGLCVTICRFPHNGKRATQAKTFKMMNKMYGGKGCNTERTFVLYIDSDIILERNAIYEFSRAMELEPHKVAYTGYITCRTSLAPWNFLVAFQDAEYLQSQLIHRSFEAVLGGVVCLPGALTMVRLRALKEVAPHYFTRLDTEKTLDYHRFHLGEDRYMTHLLMEVATNKPKERKRKEAEAKRRAAGKHPKKITKGNNAFTIGFCTSARCKTEAPDTWQKLLKQRRRWFLGAVANEIFMLTAPGLWYHTPFLMFAKLWDFGCRSMIFYVTLANVYLNNAVFPYLLDDTGKLIVSRRSEEANASLDILSIFFPVAKPGEAESIWSFAIPLSLFVGPMLIKWFVLIYVGICLKRWRMAALFPIVSILQPAYGMAYTVYALKTYALRSWGGPRTDRDGGDDAMAALERAWAMIKVGDPSKEMPYDPENEDEESAEWKRGSTYEHGDEVIEIDLAADNNRKSKMKSWFPSKRNTAVEEPKDPKSFSINFVNIKSLDEDDRVTLYTQTIDRFGSLNSLRQTLSRKGVLQRPLTVFGGNKSARSAGGLRNEVQMLQRTPSGLRNETRDSDDGVEQGTSIQNSINTVGNGPRMNNFNQPTQRQYGNQRAPTGNQTQLQRAPSGNQTQLQRDPLGSQPQHQTNPSGNPSQHQRAPSGSQIQPQHQKQASDGQNGQNWQGQHQKQPSAGPHINFAPMPAQNAQVGHNNQIPHARNPPPLNNPHARNPPPLFDPSNARVPPAILAHSQQFQRSTSPPLAFAPSPILIQMNTPNIANISPNVGNAYPPQAFVGVNGRPLSQVHQGQRRSQYYPNENLQTPHLQHYSPQLQLLPSPQIQQAMPPQNGNRTPRQTYAQYPQHPQH
ncbi:hypothetical protein HK098_006894 [Nowakowskiella sp. JEL0407]|nr:hypothetical protein HK098_006894 [Nowakowskiella sp. JEL0407]